MQYQLYSSSHMYNTIVSYLNNNIDIYNVAIPALDNHTATKTKTITHVFFYDSFIQLLHHIHADKSNLNDNDFYALSSGIVRWLCYYYVHQDSWAESINHTLQLVHYDGSVIKLKKYPHINEQALHDFIRDLDHKLYSERIIAKYMPLNKGIANIQEIKYLMQKQEILPESKINTLLYRMQQHILSPDLTISNEACLFRFFLENRTKAKDQAKIFLGEEQNKILWHNLNETKCHAKLIFMLPKPQPKNMKTDTTPEIKDTTDKSSLAQNKEL